MHKVEEKKISTVHKGNALEDAFYEYLIGQKKSGDLIAGLYNPKLCEIHKKKSYYCKDRGANVQFDVVVEVSPVMSMTSLRRIIRFDVCGSIAIPPCSL